MAVKEPGIFTKLLPAMYNPRAVKGVMEMAVVANQLGSIKLLLKAGISGCIMLMTEVSLFYGLVAL